MLSPTNPLHSTKMKPKYKICLHAKERMLTIVSILESLQVHLKKLEDCEKGQYFLSVISESETVILYRLITHRVKYFISHHFDHDGFQIIRPLKSMFTSMHSVVGWPPFAWIGASMWTNTSFSKESQFCHFFQNFIWKSRPESLEEEWRGRIHVAWSLVSTVNDDLGSPVIFWCWPTVFSEVHSQCSHLTSCMEMLVFK